MPLALILTTLLSLPTLILLVIGIRTWYRGWRVKESGAAHALFLIDALMILIVLALYLRSTWYFLRLLIPPHYPANIAIWILLFLVAFVQFALCKGYFNDR